MMLRVTARTAAVLGAVLVVGLGPAQAAPPAPASSAVAALPTAATTGVPTTALPTAATTGVPAGQKLTAMAGGIVKAGSTTISNKVITGDVRFTGSNLTLRNVRVTGHAVFRGDNVVLEDSEVGALSLSGTSGATVSRVEVTGSAGNDGIHITSGSGPAGHIVIQDTWVHNPLVTSTSHYDGIQVRGVDGLTLNRVVVDLGAYKRQYNAALFIEGVPEGNKNVTITGSSFLGGGYVMYNSATNISVTGTVLGNGRFGDLHPTSFGFATFANNSSPTGYRLVYTGGDIVATSLRAAVSAPVPSPTPSPTPTPSPSPTSSIRVVVTDSWSHAPVVASGQRYEGVDVRGVDG